MEQTNGKGHDNRSTRWPADRIEQLKELWPTMSASQIGRRMGISRMAVIGKAHRLGLMLKKLDRLHAPNRGGRPKRQKPAFIYTPPPMPAPPVVPDIPPPEFLYRMFDELGIGECHYPHGDRAPYWFCGQPCEKSCSFCAYHNRLAHHCIMPARRDLERCADWWGG